LTPDLPRLRPRPTFALLAEVGVDAGHPQGTIPHGEGAALGGPAPDVAGREHAGGRGLQLAGLVRPRPEWVRGHGTAGVQETVRFLGKAVVQPLRVRPGPDEDEQAAAVEAPAVPR